MAKEIIKGGDKLWDLKYDKVDKDRPELRGKAAAYSYPTKITQPKTMGFISEGYLEVKRKEKTEKKLERRVVRI